jgi:cytoskeleton protein RodZ
MSPGSTPFDNVQESGGEDVAVLIGRELRAARQRRGEDLYDAAGLLRIKPSYLHALEEGDHAALPGMPYLSGFLRSYAEHLGLDAHKLVWRLKGARPAMRAQAPLPRPVPAAEERRPSLVILTAILVLCGAGYGGWSYLASQIEPPVEAVAEAPVVLPVITAAQEPPPAPPTVAAPPDALPPLPAPVPAGQAGQPVVPADPAAPVAVAALPSSAPTAMDMPAVAAPAPVEATPVATAAAEADEGRPNPGVGAAIAGEARVVLVATEPAWIQIRSADRQFSRSRLMEAGERFLLPERGDLALWTGNAGGLQVMVDGVELAPLGPRGAVLRNIPLDPAALKARPGVQ